MRILHVHSGNIFGGVERILIALAGHGKYAPAMDHSFALCFKDRLASELANAGAAVHFLPEFRLAKPWQLLRARAQLKRLLREFPWDLAIVHSAWAHIAFAAVLKAAGLPLLFWLHTRAGGGSALERGAQLHFPDAVISVSQHVNQSAGQMFPGVPAEVIYSPLALDGGAFARARRPEIRSRLGARDTDVVILQASRLEPWKGHRSLLAALEPLSGVPDWVCWIAGGGEEDYANELRARVRISGLENRIRFLGPRHDIPDLLTAADIYCQANSEGEGFSIAFMEAAYASLPIVTTRIGGAVEIVDDRSGILVPPGGNRALESALLRLIQSVSLRKDLGENARKRVLAQCDPARQFQALEAVFAKTIAAHA